LHFVVGVDRSVAFGNEGELSSVEMDRDGAEARGGGDFNIFLS
jgi:hypothetical protein